MIDSVEEALLTLADDRQEWQSVRDAIHFLRQHPTPSVVVALLDALRADDYRVHWAAAEALAAMGKVAVQPLLRALVEDVEKPHLREGAKHIFLRNKNEGVREDTETIMQLIHNGAGDDDVRAAALALYDDFALKTRREKEAME